MSLDIDLIKDGLLIKDKIEFNKFELRHLAVNFAIHSLKGADESFDSWFNKISDDWIEIANRDNSQFDESQYTEYLYETNITHNLTEMADACGLYEVLWKPYVTHVEYKSCDDLDHHCNQEKELIVRSIDITDKVSAGLKILKSDPVRFKKYNSPNGWGMYKHFVPFVENYLKALKEYPKAIIKVSR